MNLYAFQVLMSVSALKIRDKSCNCIFVFSAVVQQHSRKNIKFNARHTNRNVVFSRGGTLYKNTCQKGMRFPNTAGSWKPQKWPFKLLLTHFPPGQPRGPPSSPLDTQLWSQHSPSHQSYLHSHSACCMSVSDWCSVLQQRGCFEDNQILVCVFVYVCLCVVWQQTAVIKDVGLWLKKCWFDSLWWLENSWLENCVIV